MTSVFEAGDASLAGSVPAEESLTGGQCLNERFLIEALAAIGGMGSVYRARDLATGQLVALKLLGGERSVSRFSRETHVLSELRHPAVVRYVAHGSTEAGTPFLVMEWLSGQDLSEYLLSGGLSVEQTLTLVRRIAEGLAAAHAHGVVHRDVKPSNLFLVERDPARAKVVDFGLVRRVLGPQTVTRAGGLLGTVGYMAPEQAMGVEDVDARADVFALGCVFFQCLTGRPPFVASHDVAVLAKVLREEPPLVSALRPDLGETFDGLLRRLLAKERELRPRDAASVLLELDRLGSPSGEAGPPAVQAIDVHRLTRSEQRIVSVILGRAGSRAGKTLSPEMAEAEAEGLRALSQRFAAEPVPLSGGGLLFLMSSQGAATDLAERAAHCALSLATLRRDLQLAVATGSVDTTGRMPVGVAIDRAALALEGHPGAPGVVLDEATSGLLGARFDVQRAASGARLLRHTQVQREPAALMGKRTPLVGRDKELALLSATLDECISESVARVALVTGPPGIGKTRLAFEFVRRAQERGDALVLEARADPMSRGAALNLTLRLMRSAMSLREGADAVEQRARLGAYLKDLPLEGDLAWLFEFLGELLSLPPSEPSPLLRAARNDPEVMREQTRRAVVRWLKAVLAQRPVVLVVEDLHWGDLATVLHLEEALRALSERPLMLLATARPEVHAAFPSLSQNHDLQELRLARLLPRAAERLVRAALPDVSAEVLARIVKLADGNAFYLEELIRRVADHQTADLPETVLAMAQSRLELLEPAARRVLRAASVFGETFWSGGVRSLLSSGDEEYWLESLADREIVVRRSDSRFPAERAYAFRHALLRDAAYAMLTAVDRKTAHRLAGEWLEWAGEREALVLADHFEQGGVTRRAVPCLMRAALSALDRGDFAGAASLARRGLLLQPGPSERGVLSLVNAYVGAYGMRGDLKELSDALALLPRASAFWWLALSLLIFGSATAGDPEAAKPYLQLALETAPGPELTGTYGAAMQALAAGMVLMGRPDAAWPLIERFADVRPDDPRCDLLFPAWLSLARCQLAVTSPMHGQWQLERALAWGREAETAMRTAGSRWGLLTALFYRGNAARIVGAYAEAEAALRECAEKASSAGNVVLGQYSQLILSLVLVRAQHLDEAESVLAALSASPDPNVAHGARAIAAEALLCAGAFAAAHSAAGEACTGPASPYRRMAYSTLARAQLALGRPEDALSSAERALHEGAAANPEFEADLLATQAEALLGLGRTLEAHEVLRKAEQFVTGVAANIGDEALCARFQSELSGVARVLRLVEQARS